MGPFIIQEIFIKQLSRARLCQIFGEYNGRQKRQKSLLSGSLQSSQEDRWKLNNVQTPIKITIVTGVRKRGTWTHGSCHQEMGSTEGGPREVMLELRPLKGEQEGTAFQAEGTACAKPGDRREHGVRKRPVCWNETSHNGKPDRGCLQKSLLHSKDSQRL